jgi:signal-transduction protein with cAMP-binding, CBS, and nucleotidyltransferase domain
MRLYSFLNEKEVNNNQNQVIGTISNQDALEMQRNSVSYLIQEIECSHQIDELKQIYHRVPVLVNAILANSDNAQNTTRIITSVADAITVRVIELAIENNNTPPCKFAFMAMGSEGRMEQTLTTDQDNAIVFEDTSNNNEHQLYFLNLAATINKNLNTIGYNYCKGEVMAMNKKWCQPISEWKKHFSNWIQSPDPQNILDSSIFFDFRHIFGEHQLIDELLNHVNHETHENGLFFYHMTHSIVQFKVPAIGDTIDLKKAILPLIGFMRTQALFHKLNTTNTLDRLTLLFEQAQVKKERHKELLQIYNFIMQVRIKNQALALLNNESPENSINSNSLSAIERSNLKNALAEIHQLQLQLSLQFKGIV